jgi:hypothetical protein
MFSTVLTNTFYFSTAITTEQPEPVGPYERPDQHEPIRRGEPVEQLEPVGPSERPNLNEPVRQTEPVKHANFTFGIGPARPGPNLRCYRNNLNLTHRVRSKIDVN